MDLFLNKYIFCNKESIDLSMKIKGEKIGVDYLLFILLYNNQPSTSSGSLDQIRNQELPSTNRPESTTHSTQVRILFKI